MKQCAFARVANKALTSGLALLRPVIVRYATGHGNEGGYRVEPSAPARSMYWTMKRAFTRHKPASDVEEEKEEEFWCLHGNKRTTAMRNRCIVRTEALSEEDEIGKRSVDRNICLSMKCVDSSLK
jgi:hypothetical protein